MSSKSKKTGAEGPKGKADGAKKDTSKQDGGKKSGRDETEKQYERSTKNKKDDVENGGESDEDQYDGSISSENRRKQLKKRREDTKRSKQPAKDSVLKDFSDDDDDDDDTPTAHRHPPPPTSRGTAKKDKVQPRAPRGRDRSEFSGDEDDDVQKKVQRAKDGLQELITPRTAVAAFVILLAIILGLLVTSFSSDITLMPSRSSCITRERSNRLKVLGDELGSLPREYPSLLKSIWEVIGGASYGYFEGNKEGPVVLFLAGERGKINASDVALDVADMYANVYTSRRSDSDITYVRGKTYEGKPPNKAKNIMDNVIKNGLDGCSNVVLITDVEKIPACSVMLFHGYCDNDNAPYKDAVFVFAMTLEGPIGAKGNDESIVESQLQKLWSTCPEEILPDKMVALFSRMTNNAVILR